MPWKGMKNMIIILLGAPGSGKGTISKELCSKLGLIPVATGDMFRDEIQNGTELGQKIKEYMESGNLVPDEIVIEAVKERISREQTDKSLIFDGFPRTKAQAIALDDMLKTIDRDVTAAIEMSIADEEIVKRIVNRRMCSNKQCGAIYNLATRPPKVENVCDICGSSLVKRKDDEEATVRKRLGIYHEQAESVLHYYKQQDKLCTVVQNPQSKTSLEDSVKTIETYLSNK